MAKSRKKKSPIFCDHANEVPVTCSCNADCYCKDNTCKPRKEPPKEIETQAYVPCDNRVVVLLERIASILERAFPVGATGSPVTAYMLSHWSAANEKPKKRRKGR